MTLNVLEAGARTPLGVWADRRPRVARLLEEWRPDVVGLQEATSEQLRDIAADAPDFEVVAGPPSGTPCLPGARLAARVIGHGQGDEGEYCAALFRRDRFALAEQRAFWLSASPDRPGTSMPGSWIPRVANCVTVTEVGTGRALRVCSTHVDVLPWAWARSATALRKGLGRSEAERADILLGDFNAPARSALYRRLRQAGWRDTWLEAGETQGPEGTYHAGRGVPRWPGRIDRIYYRPAATVERAVTATPADDAPPPSDHFAVVAYLEWP